MRLRDWFFLGLAALVFVLWTEYAYQRGVAIATYQCEYGDAGQIN